MGYFRFMLAQETNSERDHAALDEACKKGTMPFVSCAQDRLGPLVLRALPWPRFARALAVLVTASTSSACVSELAADTTAGFLADAAPAARAYFDYESAGLAAANGVMQLEGLHRVSPDNDRINLTLAQAYVAYAFGWVMDRYEEAHFAGDYERADHEKQRAFLMYTRAYTLVVAVMRDRDAQIDAKLEGDPDALRAYLAREYDDPEDDIEVVFWCALTLGSAITNAPSMDSLIDLPIAKALAEHSVKLNPAYENAGALTLLGGFEASYPEQLGGNWKRGREMFERALSLSKRQNHIHHVNFARTYAVSAQDRELFLLLMHEVIEAPDQGDAVRLSNKVARRRAHRYLAYVDELFL
jgi:hypothetical protein